MNKNTGNKKVLLAFRDFSEGKLLALAFRQAGFEVDIVHSGINALKCIETNSGGYDFLITELILDEVSGLAICMVAKKNDNTKVIAISSDNPSLNSIACGAFSIDYFVSKPLDVESLIMIAKANIEQFPSNE